MPAQAVLLNTITLPQFTDLVRREWLEMPNLVPYNAERMFIFDDLQANTGDVKRYNEIDTQTFARSMPEGVNAVKASNAVGYEKDMNAKRFGIEVDITFQMRRFNRYPEVISQLTSLSRYQPQRQELDLTHRLTFAGASSYVNMDGETIDLTTGDGQPLVSAGHLLAFSALTYTNLVAGAPTFSQGALEAAELIAKNNILNNFGDKRIMDWNCIFSGKDPNTVRMIRQLMDSTADVDAVQAGIVNTYKGTKQHIMLDWLDTTATGADDATKRRYWGIACIGQGQMGWQAYLGIFEPMNLKTPAPGNNGEDCHNDVWSYGSRMTRGICIPNPRGIIMSLVVS
jgi:hypothetical protein